MVARHQSRVKACTKVLPFVPLGFSYGRGEDGVRAEQGMGRRHMTCLFLAEDGPRGGTPQKGRDPSGLAEAVWGLALGRGSAYLRENHGLAAGRTEAPALSLSSRGGGQRGGTGRP